MSKFVTDTEAEFRTALPLRKGSDGFDTRQDYLIKGYLPSSSVASASGMLVRLIILDTLARCFGGSDENAAKVIQGCDAIKAATQATVLIIHHSGKDQDKGARGSSAFRAALDGPAGAFEQKLTVLPFR